jgi:hypothetical protein
VSQSRWHAALIEDVELLTARLRRPTTDTYKARAKTSLCGLAHDDEALPGFMVMVDRGLAPAFGLGADHALVDADGPVANALRASAVEHGADGGAMLFTAACAPWLSPAHAAAYVCRLRAVLAAAAVAEASR